MRAVKHIVVRNMETNRNYRVNFALLCNLERVNIGTGATETRVGNFHNKSTPLLESTNVSELYDEAVDSFTQQIADQLREKGSGWRFLSIVRLIIYYYKYQPLRGNSYIPLPKELKDKEAIINLKNTDDQCFKWQ